MNDDIPQVNTINESTSQEVILPGLINFAFNLYSFCYMLLGLAIMVLGIGTIALAFLSVEEIISRSSSLPAIPTIILGILFIKISLGIRRYEKWVIPSVTINTLSVVLLLCILNNLNISGGVLSALFILVILEIIFLIILYTYKEKLKGEYFSPLVVFLLIASLFIPYITLENLTEPQNQNAQLQNH